MIKEYVPPTPLFINGKVTPGCEWVLEGKGLTYNYLDGLPAYIIAGRIHKVSNGQWIPCRHEDAVYNEARSTYIQTQGETPLKGAYQVIGYRVGNNPYGFLTHVLVRVENENLLTTIADRSYAGMMEYFAKSPVYAVLFVDGIKTAIAKRTEFGFKWPPFTVFY